MGIEDWLIHKKKRNFNLRKLPDGEKKSSIAILSSRRLEEVGADKVFVPFSEAASLRLLKFASSSY